MARRWWYPDRDDLALVISRIDSYFAAASASTMTGKTRDERLLDAALTLPRQRFYPTTMDKAAALLRSMIKNHPFVDGNKRIAVVLTEMFLEENGYVLTARNPALVTFTLALAASSPPMPLAEVTRWLRAHTRPSPM